MPSIEVPLISPIARIPRASILGIPCRTCYTTGPAAATPPNTHLSKPMSDYKSDFLRVLSERGYIHQISDVAGLDAAAAAKKVVCYVGYDCTAPSLHIGHLISIMMLH